MSEYLPQILGVFLVIAFIRIFWGALSKLGSSDDKYDAERRRIQRRKKELGIEDEPVEIEEPKGSGFIKGFLEITVGFAFTILAIGIGFYVYTNA
jgi:uncharacterized membrane protein YfcA